MLIMLHSFPVISFRFDKAGLTYRCTPNIPRFIVGYSVSYILLNLFPTFAGNRILGTTIQIISWYQTPNKLFIIWAQFSFQTGAINVLTPDYILCVWITFDKFLRYKEPLTAYEKEKQLPYSLTFVFMTCRVGNLKCGRLQLIFKIQSLCLSKQAYQNIKFIIKNMFAQQKRYLDLSR